jgi:hypothetical protein
MTFLHYTSVDPTTQHARKFYSHCASISWHSSTHTSVGNFCLLNFMYHGLCRYWLINDWYKRYLGVTKQLEFATMRVCYNPRQSRTLFEIFEWGHETKISWLEEYVFGMCFNFCVFKRIYLLNMSASLILQITLTFTNSEFVPIWYIWIAISAIGILCIKQ